MATKLKTRRRSKPRGATAVEFAIVAPIFFMLVFGLFEFSRLMMLYNSAQNAAFEGARASVAYRGTPQAAIERAESVMEAIGAKAYNITVKQKKTNVECAVEVPFDQNAFVTPWFAEGYNIRVKCSLNCEEIRAGQEREIKNENLAVDHINPP
jgi:Flp pilus assembly protein TadG